jgi:hypothetical protein
MDAEREESPSRAHLPMQGQQSVVPEGVRVELSIGLVAPRSRDLVRVSAAESLAQVAPGDFHDRLCRTRRNQLSIRCRIRFAAGGEPFCGFAPGLIVRMSPRPAILWRVGLHQSPPPLHWPASMLHPPVGTVNHHLPRGRGIFDRPNGEISTGVDKRDGLDSGPGSMIYIARGTARRSATEPPAVVP